MVENILNGLLNLLNLHHILFINFGLIIGIIFGSLPGLTATMGVALFLPITFSMNPVTGILLLLGIYCGGIYGGSITAILIKTPGTPASAATVFDGYPLAQKGHPGKALKMALVASTIAGIISALMLLFIAPLIAKVALRFGPPEYFALALFGLSIISSVSGENILKGLISGCLGMFISTIGLDPLEALPRLTFGIDSLVGGIELLPALIGLFAIAEVLNKIYKGDSNINGKIELIKEKLSLREIKENLVTIFRSGIIGTLIGAIPGTGATTSSFLSYSEAKRSSKHPELFGTGSLEGIAASEAGNNGVTGATLIPLLTLGIPGDPVTAVMLGALMMQGLTPGPALFETQSTIVYTIMIGLIFVNIFMFLQGSLFIKLFIKVTQIPTNFLITILTVLCIIGGFAVRNSIFDVIILVAFGAIGYIMIKIKMPVVPMLLAIVLGPIAEESMRQSLIISQGSYAVFFTRPISACFLLIAVLSIVVPFIRTRKKSHIETI